MRQIHKFSLTILSVAFSIAGAAPSLAADYPEKRITFVVPYAPGGATDILGRLVANGLKDRLGQAVIVENRAGAATQIGSNYVGQAAPDGYTLLFTTPLLAQAPYFPESSLKYDPVRGYTPIIKAFSAPWFLYVNSNLPTHNIREFLAHGKANRGKLNFGSAGSEIQFADFLNNIGFELVVVPFKGMSDVFAALAGNNVQVAFASYQTGKPYVDAGKIRAIGIASPRRSTIATDVPTLAESGQSVGAIPDLWFGLVGPAALPAPVLTRLNREVNNYLNDPGTRAKVSGEMYFEIVGGAPEEFTKDIVANMALFKRLTSK